ncbi:MAG: hypothetical protein IJA67_07985 [Oscillospiraceae bacterium]|nr:hypothetical protein [Oscillospiraceae bacterium]
MKTVKIISICAVIALLILGCISFISVNNKYPPKELNEYKIGESLEYEGYSFCVYGAELYKYYDFKDKYNYVDVARIEVYLEENDTHMLMVNLKVKNITDEALPVPPVFYFTLQSIPGAYSSVGNLDVMRFLYNDDLTFLDGTLEPDEEIDILIPFSVDAAYLSFYKDNQLNIEDFMFVISLYPEKNYFDLGTKQK